MIRVREQGDPPHRSLSGISPLAFSRDPVADRVLAVTRPAGTRGVFLHPVIEVPPPSFYSLLGISSVPPGLGPCIPGVGPPRA